ncbi:peroxiredoxin%2C Ohr subfamily [Legionella pneumophila]|nr:peroxiredoxin%2C Ohr subfamily [Legionella pneumophila]
MKALYTTIAKTHGGRNGHVETTDGLLKLDLAMPRELGGRVVPLIQSNYLPRDMLLVLRVPFVILPMCKKFL